MALLGQAPASLTCADPEFSAPRDTVTGLATRELGSARLSGPQDTENGWAVAAWLVAHTQRLAVDRVTFDGRTWTAASGTWQTTGAADGRLALHRVGEP